MKISHKDNTVNGLFYIEQAGELLAEMTYKWNDNCIIIDHTFVSPLLAGKGIGKQLVDQAVAFAREKHITIIPTCWFVKKILNSSEHYQDVLHL